MKFLKSLLILGLFSTAQILISADEELVVTGSYLKDKTLESSPVDVLSAADLENLNISSLAEIGKYIHTSSGSHFQSDSLEGTDQGMANINLRGLNLSATLVMINSKRNTLAGLPAESGDSYVDINLIPQIAVEQIEILKEGATSLYGSDAIAGVVNFLTYKNFNGGKLKFGNQKTQHYGQNERKLEFLYGNSLNDINFVLGLEILDRSSLPSKKIEGIRALNEFVAMTHSVSNHRVAIIFDAHNMNINSQNALLKTLEELPENKHIFLVSNNTVSRLI